MQLPQHSAPGQTCSLTLSFPRRRWRFPEERFVSYEPSDEPWCRYLGIGEEVEEVESVELRALVTRVDSDGTVWFRALPAHRVAGLSEANICVPPPTFHDSMAAEI